MTSEHGGKVYHGPLLESMYKACSTQLTTGLACTLSLTRQNMEHGGRLPANCTLTVYYLPVSPPYRVYNYGLCRLTWDVIVLFCRLSMKTTYLLTFPANITSTRFASKMPKIYGHNIHGGIYKHPPGPNNRSKPGASGAGVTISLCSCLRTYNRFWLPCIWKPCKGTLSRALGLKQVQGRPKLRALW